MHVWPETLKKLAGGFIDLLYPPRCHVCGTNVESISTGMICTICMEQVRFLQSPICPKCGKQMNNAAGMSNHHCGECLKTTPPFDSARSLVRYLPPVSTLLQRLKYRGDTTVAGPLTELMRRNAHIWPWHQCDCIIPVPLFISRLRDRGLNQSQVLAEFAFPEKRGKIATNLLVRLKNTTAQTGLDGIERRKNLRGAFAVTDVGQVRNRHLWLVDDVFTTGTTVAECSKTLKKSGAASVHVWTLARA